MLGFNQTSWNLFWFGKLAENLGKNGLSSIYSFLLELNQYFFFLLNKENNLK